MPDYRWGILLAEKEDDRRIGFGDHLGKPVLQEVPGEYRNLLKRIIVTQADTEPGSVEQQRMLAHTAPSLYDMRNLFQVNVEEARHLWAMVYLLHKYFGMDGRQEADLLLQRRSGNPDRPRILGTFNEPIRDWLDFFGFAMYCDRDGKFQLLSLAESGFDPLSRTARFMLTEEAHHLSVGDLGIQRVVERTAQLMRETPGKDVREYGGIPLGVLQRYINFWASSSTDLFGGEQGSTASDVFSVGLKGRAWEARKYRDHTAIGEAKELETWKDGRLVKKQVPLRNALNEVLREEYRKDLEQAAERWNNILEGHGIGERLRVPDRRFNRNIGVYAGHWFDLDGNILDEETWQARRGEWLPTEEDYAFVQSLMQPVHQAGKIAGWIAPPAKGINGQPFEYEYVRI